MMSVLLTARRRLILLVAYLFVLVALFPMRLAFDMLGLQENGISARAVHGSVWWGSIEQLNLGSVPLGNVEARLSPVQLFVGRARMDFSRRNGASDDLKGAISVNSSSFGIDDVTANLAAGRMFAPLPVSGLDLQDVSVRFTDGACVRAQGRVKARIAPMVQGLDLSQGLSGDASCNGSSLLLPLVSQSGLEKLTLRVEGNGAYNAELLVNTSDEALAADLQKNGFTRGGDGTYALTVRGRL